MCKVKQNRQAATNHGGRYSFILLGVFAVDLVKISGTVPVAAALRRADLS
jgi:hypothetical protein